MAHTRSGVLAKKASCTFPVSIPTMCKKEFVILCNYCKENHRKIEEKNRKVDLRDFEILGVEMTLQGRLLFLIIHNLCQSIFG